MTDTERLQGLMDENYARQGITAPFGSPEYRRRLAARTHDVVGNPITPVTVDDIVVGYEVYHATLRWDEGGVEVTDQTPKGGVVYRTYEADGVRRVQVFEPREVRRKIQLRQYDWAVSELDPERCHPMRDAAKERTAKTLLKVAAQNQRTWDYDLDDTAVMGALVLTDEVRLRRAAVAAARPASCAEGHCTSPSGDCAEARDHLGVCCYCDATVPSRSGGKVAAS